MINIKNLHYLKMYPKIEEYFKTAVEKADQGDVTFGYVSLRMCLESIEKELLKDNEWYINRVAMKDRPSSEDSIKRLRYERVITEKQMDLFNAIRRMGNKYSHGETEQRNEVTDLEALKIFCVRLDNEFPSIMAHLGVGGSTRKQFVDNENKIKEEQPIKKDNQSAQNQAPRTQPLGRIQRPYSSNAGSTNNYHSTYSSNYNAPYFANKKSLKSRILSKLDSTPIFAIRFIITALIAAGLLFVIFSDNSKYIDKALNDAITKGNTIIAKNERSNLDPFIPDFVETANKGFNILIPNRKIKLLETVKNGVKFTGYNGKGRLVLTDQTLYSDSIYKIINERNIISVYKNGTNKYLGSSSFAIENSIDLSNGDVCVIRVDQDLIDKLNSLNISLNTKSIEITVDGLLDPQGIIDQKDNVINRIQSTLDQNAKSYSTDSMTWTAIIHNVYYVPLFLEGKDAIVVYATYRKDLHYFGYSSQYFTRRMIFNVNITNRAVLVDTSDYNEEYLHEYGDSVGWNMINKDFSDNFSSYDPIKLK